MTPEEIKAKAIAHKQEKDDNERVRLYLERQQLIEDNNELIEYAMRIITSKLPSALIGSGAVLSHSVPGRDAFVSLALERILHFTVDVGGTKVMVRLDLHNREVQYFATHDGRNNPAGMDYTDDFLYALACSVENFM